jgi:hypothetical protein
LSPIGPGGQPWPEVSIADLRRGVGTGYEGDVLGSVDNWLSAVDS